MTKRQAQDIKTTLNTAGWKYIQENLDQLYDKCKDEALDSKTLQELRGKQEVRKFVKSFMGRLEQACEIADQKEE